MSFIANGIGVANNGAAPALGTLPIEGYAGGNTIIMAQDPGVPLAQITARKEAIGNNQLVLSNNYLHLGNMYRSYRVQTVTTRLSGSSLLGEDSATSTQRVSALVCTLLGTDDLDAVNNLNDAHLLCRPFNRMHRFQTTTTFVRSSVNKPTTVTHRISVNQLVRDRTTLTSADYVGSITPAVTPGTTYPTYSDPAKLVYHSIVIHPYSYSDFAQAPAFPPSNVVFTGYLTVTKIVQFFAPHDNSDLYGAV